MEGAAVPSTQARKKSATIDREWLKNADTLPIDENTTDDGIKAFAAKVSGETIALFEVAVREIVAQARSELAAIKDERSKYALLVCQQYYMRWRGKRAISANPRTKATRHGLFLVRACVRCRKTGTRGDVAVFRVNAYRTGDKGDKKGRYAYRLRGHATTAHAKCGTGTKETIHNPDEPWSCACCKHLYCTDAEHGDGTTRVEGAPRPLKAKCDSCKANRWRKRSKSKSKRSEFIEGDAGKRKEESSYYEPLRKDMYFTDAGFDADSEIGKGLVTAYNAKRNGTATDEAISASTSGAIAGRTRSQSKGVAIGEAPRIVERAAASDENATELDSEDQRGAFAQRAVPKITLTTAAPLRRSKRRAVAVPSFGRFV